MNGKTGNTSGAEAAIPEIAAAKLHVLHLDPIKTKMGDKWERLSNLVHKLFERTLHQTQGPRDHFLLVDELSYIVTFHDLSLEEAGVACASVAQKVCGLLFGSEIDDIAVRSLVGPVSAALLSGELGRATRIAEILERRGGEIIVTPSSLEPGWRKLDQENARAAMRWEPYQTSRGAHHPNGSCSLLCPDLGPPEPEERIRFLCCAVEVGRSCELSRDPEARKRLPDGRNRDSDFERSS